MPLSYSPHKLFCRCRSGFCYYLSSSELSGLIRPTRICVSLEIINDVGSTVCFNDMLRFAMLRIQSFIMFWGIDSPDCLFVGLALLRHPNQASSHKTGRSTSS